MTGKQHLSFGIITGIAFSAYLHKLNICQNNADMVFVVCGSVLGSLLPDIDSTESIISNILPPFTTLISKIINNVFGHRGLLHYSLFWIVMAFFTANYNHFTQGLFFGVFGHLFLDACTYKGIPALSWIIDRNKSFYVFPKKVEDVCWKKTNKYCFLYFCCISHKWHYFSDNALISVQKKSNCVFSVILIMRLKLHYDDFIPEVEKGVFDRTDKHLNIIFNICIIIIIVYIITTN